MKAYFINSSARTVTQVEYADLAELQRYVGGFIEPAYQWTKTGDVLYVDEEGLLKNYEHFFCLLQRPDQPFAGNGMLVGREIGDTANTRPPTMTLDELRSCVTWLSPGATHLRRPR